MSDMQPPRKPLRRLSKLALGFLIALIGVVTLIVASVFLFGCGSATGAPPNQSGQAALAATANANATNVAISLTALSNDLTQTASTPDVVPTYAPVTPVTPVWHTTHSWTGNGPKNTELITVPDDWKITYACTYQDGGAVDGVLTVEVYGADNSILDVAIDATCHDAHTTGETEEHQAGSVYLKVNSTGAWTVQVQEAQ